ncbi:PhzF family phenazine biosynthesis protein [Dermatophilus congolensis]|uniref:Uncharacterized isomerase yddE n=1 Tax=Dermatophilus congolensis TaxID=1863 RepID=A0AA46BPK5_9MICO|nr:PhzF family phenazine biosynthesis protein [Dermatophilus congolensis]MBO3143562.1 PhzF family phenazine biosynthesis protein [Dermatophilus congolensis]MBO3152554.1 PhzF family phenazine biosynthesis protein [Dermatophilus congolensis]MBO3160435.1 PhzF family phenazine biosynthesis protein [Dermatophilus congolensis]MBO3163839.1 PhzF family phenazine biosynthesis protein [Dermatophilus congolensis]MBO3177386.1 PhzF family phenazine biosynthesis protein [Dermatophilus congolensis]
MEITYRLVNVFTDGDDPFSGNAVAIFEDGSELSTYQMQALSQELNQEAVFIFPNDDPANAQVRFFSPHQKKGFAGSASLATAHVVRDMMGSTGDVTLHEAQYGNYHVQHVADSENKWMFQGSQRQTRELKASPQILASLVGLSLDAIAAAPATVSSTSGTGGIILPVRTIDDVRETRLDARLLHSYAMLLNTVPSVYVWAESDEDEVIHSRMFYGPRGGVLEVAATGSGAANLGAWFASQGRGPISRHIRQGRPLGRGSHVDLTVDESGDIFVGGRTLEVSRGTFHI